VISQPDIVNVCGFGCSEALLRLVMECGNVQLVMTKPQFEYIHQYLEKREDGTWVRKSQS
jgi:hypothetical protein